MNSRSRKHVAESAVHVGSTPEFAGTDTLGRGTDMPCQPADRKNDQKKKLLCVYAHQDDERMITGRR
jgi:hypothetical protein